MLTQQIKLFLYYLEYLIKLYESKAGPLGQMEQKRLGTFLRQRAQFKKFDVQSKFEFMFDGYIVKGEIQSCIQDENDGVKRYNDYCYVQPRENDFNVTKTLICLVFNDAIDVIKQDRLEQLIIKKLQINVLKNKNSIIIFITRIMNIKVAYIYFIIKNCQSLLN
ncbi:unnamed protein product [Paramecium primaurelia]|uniref:Uncharacterized protein n=1 Tax=Paramecium primaurelia TaxID=5886 RepID=A0A8S1NJ42_PARPR|nr:unnamed protein product [Paramecium primaurelia]